MSYKFDKKEIDIRRARKESLYCRELSQLFLKIIIENSELSGIHVSSVKLSPDKSVCNVLFFSEDGYESFEKKLPTLILYKPSMRKAISQNISSRYTPNLVFKYDSQMEKQRKVEALFERLKDEGQL